MESEVPARLYKCLGVWSWWQVPVGLGKALAAFLSPTTVLFFLLSYNTCQILISASCGARASPLPQGCLWLQPAPGHSLPSPSPSPSPGGCPAAGGCRTTGEAQEPSTSPVASVPMTQWPYGTITSNYFSPASQGRGQVLSTAGSCGSLWVCRSSHSCRNGRAHCMCSMHRTNEFQWVSGRLPDLVTLAALISKQLVKQWEILDSVNFGNQQLEAKQRFLAVSRASLDHPMSSVWSQPPRFMGHVN